jgi:hypothetical protein
MIDKYNLDLKSWNKIRKNQSIQWIKTSLF